MWINSTQVIGESGLVEGKLNLDSGEFWYRRTDPETGQTSWASNPPGKIAWTDPSQADTALTTYTQSTQTGNETAVVTTTLATVAGFDPYAFQARRFGLQWQALNPASGVWEQAYRVPNAPSAAVPESIAQAAFPASDIVPLNDPQEKFDPGSLIPALVFAFATYGASLSAQAAVSADAATAAGDIGSLAFPVDQATMAAQWGASDVATLAGDLGGASFPVDQATIGQQWGSAVTPADAATLAGDIGGNAFPVDQATTAGQWGTYVAPSFSVPQIIQDTGRKLLSAVTGTVGASLASSLLANANAAELGKPATIAPDQPAGISGTAKIIAGAAIVGALLAVITKGKK